MQRSPFMRSIGSTLAAALAVVLFSGPIWAQGNISVHVGGGVVKEANREVCARKALKVLEKEKLLYAEVDSEGHVWGFGEKAAVMVLCLANPEGAAFIVCAASGDPKEAERLRNTVREQIAEMPHDPQLPRHVGTLDPMQKAKVSQLRWQVAPHSMVSTLRFFDAAAAITLEKQGMSAPQCEKTLVLGAGRGGVAAAFAAPGANGLSVNVGVAVASWDDALSARLAKSLERALVSVLYE
jgi:hypothetical protein